MKAVVCETWEELETASAGAILFERDGAIIKCPGCGRESYLPDRNRTEERPSWTMNRKELNIMPSVHHVKGCGWHGFLKKGRWRSC